MCIRDRFLFYRLQQNTHRGATATMGHGRIFVNGGLAYDLQSGGLLKGLGAGSVASAGKTLWRGTSNTLENWELVERAGKDRKGKPVKILELKRKTSIAKVPGGQGMLVAGTTVVSAGAKSVAMIDATSGKLTWQHDLDGTPGDLAVSDGRLFVVTDSGRLYCFAEGPVAKPVHHSPSKPDIPGDDPAIVAAGKKILETSRIREGYCVDLGLSLIHISEPTRPY